MNRSSKGFGLAGVAVAVALMFVTAVFSSSAKSAECEDQPHYNIVNPR